MVRRGWRNLLYLKYATAKAKAKRPLHLGKAAPSGTIENVGCERARLRVLRILASLEGSLRKLRFLRRISSRDEAKKSTYAFLGFRAESLFRSPRELMSSSRLCRLTTRQNALLGETRLESISVCPKLLSALQPTSPTRHSS